MSEFINVLLCPHQRRKHVQAELERLTPGVLFMGQLDMSELDLSRMEWAERREGVLVRWRRSILDVSMPRILSGRLNGPILLAYICDETMWGYRLYYKGSPVDAFDTMPVPFEAPPPDPPTPEQRAARLASYFSGGRDALREYLIPWAEAEKDGEKVFPSDTYPRGNCWQLEDFINNLAPWAYKMLTSDELAPTATAPVPDVSSPHSNAPDHIRPPQPPEPGPEACLPFLTGVRAVRRGWTFPLSLLYRLFPQKRPAPETVPHEGWGLPELEDILERFYTGKLTRLELDFTLQGEGTYIRRLRKTVYQPFRLTLELIREKNRCMCLLLDGQDRTVYRLIADRDTYMTVDISQLEHTVFCGQDVESYTVFVGSVPETFRRETALLLSRLENRDGVLSATARMGVWSCAGLHFSVEQHERHQREWCLK